MLPQGGPLAILAEFLHGHGCEKVKKLSIDTSVQLARLVFQENVFVYNKKYDRQIVGGLMGPSFPLTLANIFVWK